MSANPEKPDSTEPHPSTEEERGVIPGSAEVEQKSESVPEPTAPEPPAASAEEAKATKAEATADDPAEDRNKGTEEGTKTDPAMETDATPGIPAAAADAEKHPDTEADAGDNTLRKPEQAPERQIEPQSEPQPEPEPQAATVPHEPEKFREQLQGISPKDSKTLDSLQAGIQQAPEAMREQLQQELQPLVERHIEWQDQLKQKATDHMHKLEQALEAGNIRDVQSHWDRSRNAVQAIRDDAAARLQEQLAPLQARVTELLDWKRFADTEKKKELIESMQKMLETDLHPGKRAKQIRAMQEQWRKLGHTDDNDTLWKQFSETARQAFEPCKEYFRERKEVMRNNLIERNRIIEQLEAYIEDNQGKEVNVPEVNKLEKEAREAWKKFAPVQQNRIRDLQAQFNKVLKRLRQQRHEVLEEHAQQKEKLVTEARALLDSEPLEQAISQAKQLQQQWKQIGPAPHKQERKLWEEFRGACDQLFGRRDAVQQEAREEEKAALKTARDHLQEIQQLLELPDEQFLDARRRFNELRKATEAALPEQRGRPSPEHRKLLDRLKQLGQRHDQRRKAMPDRKQLQLQATVDAPARFCQRIEEKLLAGNSTDIPDTDSMQAEWDALEKPDDRDLASLLKKRFGRLLDNRQAPEAMQKLAKDVEKQARELCVEMEILAGVDSPAEDKAVRMQCQLNHLQKGLGHHAGSNRERAQQINTMALQFDCLGPLPDSIRNTLQERIRKVRQSVS